MSIVVVPNGDGSVTVIDGEARKIVRPPGGEAASPSAGSTVSAGAVAPSVVGEARYRIIFTNTSGGATAGLVVMSHAADEDRHAVESLDEIVRSIDAGQLDSVSLLKFRLKAAEPVDIEAIGGALRRLGGGHAQAEISWDA